MRPTITKDFDPTRTVGDLLETVQAAFEWLPIGLLVVGKDGRIVLANRELQRMFGYGRAELVGRSVDDLVPDATRPTHTELRREFVSPPDAPAMAGSREIFGRRKDGSELPVEVGLAPMHVHTTLFVIASVRDISERHHGEVTVRTAADDQLRFEELVSELGAEFINLRPQEIDRAIEDALSRVVRMLDLDFSALFQFAEESDDFVKTHHWTRPGLAPPPARVSARHQFPWHLARVRSGELVSYATLDDVPDAADREHLRQSGLKSAVTVPVMVGGRVWGTLSFAAVRDSRVWAGALINRLRMVALIVASALARKQTDDALRGALVEVAALCDRRRDENAYLRQQLRIHTGAPVIVAHSAAARSVLEQVGEVAPTDSPVLIVGETGTGKTLFATRVHELSARSDRSLVRVRCASLSAASMDTELFGSDKGAYLEGETRQMGRLELANHSTVFLHEIADLTPEAQACLTRVLQERHIQPQGSARPVKLDLRVIATTRRDLPHHVTAGTFRADLYDLLNGVTIHIPALRNRPGDIPLLIWRFVNEFAEAYGKPIDAIDNESMMALQQYAWPGNARELRNVVEHAMIAADSRQLRIPLPGHRRDGAPEGETLAAVEKAHIVATLAASGWEIRGSDGAAARLGISPQQLELKIAKLRLRRPRH